jgi:hypothetical protein
VKELVVSDSYTDKHYKGPWSFTFTLAK